MAVHGGAREDGGGGGGAGDARRGFARTFRHVLERLRVPGLNKPLHFLAFQRRRRFSLPQVSRRVVGKDSNPLSPLSSSSPALLSYPFLTPSRVHRGHLRLAGLRDYTSSFVFAFHPVAPSKHPRLPMTRSHPLKIGRFRWRDG